MDIWPVCNDNVSELIRQPVVCLPALNRKAAKRRVMKQIRILLIEDDFRRIQKIRDWLPDHVVLVEAKSAGQAMGILQRIEPGELTAIMLDHDLHQQARTSADLSLSGNSLISLICRCVDTEVPILVHSLNPTGASSMVARLDANGYDVTRMPFDTMTKATLTGWLSDNCEYEPE